jgi:hypothetical protein
MTGGSDFSPPSAAGAYVEETRSRARGSQRSTPSIGNKKLGATARDCLPIYPTFYLSVSLSPSRKNRDGEINVPSKTARGGTVERVYLRGSVKLATAAGIGVGNEFDREREREREGKQVSFVTLACSPIVPAVLDTSVPAVAARRSQLPIFSPSPPTTASLFPSLLSSSSIRLIDSAPSYVPTHINAHSGLFSPPYRVGSSMVRMKERARWR